MFHRHILYTIEVSWIFELFFSGYCQIFYGWILLVSIFNIVVVVNVNNSSIIYVTSEKDKTEADDS